MIIVFVSNMCPFPFISTAANVKQLWWLTRVSSGRETWGIPKADHELRTTALAIEEHIRTTLMFLPLSSSGFLLNYSDCFCVKVSLAHVKPGWHGQTTNFCFSRAIAAHFLHLSAPRCQVCLFRFSIGLSLQRITSTSWLWAFSSCQSMGEHQQGWVVGPTIIDTGDWIWASNCFKNMTYFTPWIYNRLMEIRLESVLHQAEEAIV